MISTMPRIEIATPDEVYSVALAMRERDLAEFSAALPVHRRLDVAANLALRYGGRDDVLVGAVGGEPICIGGTVQVNDAIHLLFFATDKFPTIAVSITRFIRNELFPRFFAAGINRVECASIEGYDHAHRWLRLLGLKDAGRAEFTGRGGEAFVHFVRKA